ncbi:hypothetical protein ACIP79_00785 [Streptomyces sp. NPDC088747]|uniref:hypothetical protein n=1 Tax=Streptomyces sp. NPDC088747 TaxID=3365886 RepID=UPI0038144141
MPSKVIECDWCTQCGTPRPGFIDPAEKWKKAEGESKEVQGLPADRKEGGAAPRTEMRNASPGREEAA